MTEPEYPCPVCGVHVGVLGVFGRVSRDESGRVRSHAKEQRKCEKCGAELERYALPGEQWQTKRFNAPDWAEPGGSDA